MARFLVVPQWQGSSSARAMAHIDGAEAIAGDLPRAACVAVDVPLEAGDSLGTGVLRASALLRVRDGIASALAAESEPVIVIGGDGGVSVPAIGHVAGDDLAVVWFDAHGALHDTRSSASGAYAGMALRSVLGEGPDGLSLSPGTIGVDRAVLAGSRSLEEAEAEFIATSGLRRLAPASFAPESLLDAVTATGASRVYVHIDLDVLDPAHVSGVTEPHPFGLDPATLVAAIAALREALPLAGASVTGFAPASPAAALDDLGTILRIIGALAR